MLVSLYPSPGLLARLKAQGVDAANISTFDGGDDNKQQFTNKGGRPNTAQSSRSKLSPSKQSKLARGRDHSGAHGGPPKNEPSPGLKLIIEKIKVSRGFECKVCSVVVYIISFINVLDVYASIHEYKFASDTSHYDWIFHVFYFCFSHRRPK